MGWIQGLKDKSIEKDNALLDTLLEYNPSAKFLDVGCGDGRRTQRWARCIGTSDVVGVDVKDFGVPFRLIRWDVDKGLPFRDESFDVVVTHHVVEHVSGTDLFISEIHRVLKEGGYLGIVTPNLASGRVILELILDRQPLWACISDQFFLRGFTDELLEKGRGFLHRRLFTMEGLVGLLTHYGFKIEHKKRHGYGPLFFGGVLGGLYAANLSVKARK